MGLVGRKIGPYSVVEEIGAGGMAVVYRAEQPSLDRMVAIKELRSEFAREKSIIQRFEREARCIAALAHHNIVHIYDFVTRSNSMFIVMEHVDGIDLYDLMTRVERLPPDVAAIIAVQAASALEYAHFRGVVHRDFKPSNLMITKQGDVKLMDFGIARDETDVDLTRPGMALGTPAYMSPEQIMGEKVDFRSDLFSFGIVLYQMLTGQKPFVDDETAGVMNRIINEGYKRPRSIYPDIPRPLQRIIRRCLQKDLNARYPSTEAMRRELETFVSRKVRINYNGRLVIYLRHRDIITDDEAKTYVRIEELNAPDSVEVDSGRLSNWNVVLKPMLAMNAVVLLLLAGWAAVVGWAALGSNQGQLWVNADPWAKVYVNGRHVVTTPHAGAIELPPGLHKVEFKNDYFHTETRNIDLEAGEVERLHVNLKRKRR